MKFVQQLTLKTSPPNILGLKKLKIENLILQSAGLWPSERFVALGQTSFKRWS